MEALKEFPSEYIKSFRSSVDLLKNFNIRYLEDDRSFIKKYWRFFYIGPIWIMHLVSATAHMVILISKKDIISFAYRLPIFLVTIHATLKAVVIIPKTAEISSIIRDLGFLWRTNYTEKQTIEKNRLLKILHFCNRANYWTTMIGATQYAISPMMETLIRRFILQQQHEFLLPVAGSYPFDPFENWFIYTAVYLYQCYTLFLIGYVYTGSKLILITLSGLIANEFIMLKDDLRRAKPALRNNIKDHEHDVREFVQRHQKLIELSQHLDNVFNRMIFIELLFVGITTCAFRFAGAFARGLTYTLINYVAVSFTLVTVFYMCYYGELLTAASTRLGEVAYQNLYRGGPQNKMAIWFIIKICQKPRGLTSLRYTAVSLNTFTKVVSTTWSYFSLMNSVYTVAEE